MFKKSRLKKPRPGLTLDSASVQDNVPTEIINGVYIGSVHCAFNKESLAEYGITHILNISGVPATYPRNFTYLQVTMRDKEYANLLSAIPAANVFIESSLDAHGKILVHCKGGRSRSAAFISAFIMSTRRLLFDEAFQMVKSKRPIVNVNKGFEQQLIAYGRSEWDVYGAHQFLLKEHFNNILEEYESNGQVIVRQLASCALSTPVRLRLTRPQSSGVQIIPPLRGSDMQFVCRQCKTPLFVTCSIVLPSRSNSDEKRESPRRKSSIDSTNPRPPRLRRHYASDTIASFSKEELNKFKLNEITSTSSNEDMEIVSPSKLKRGGMVASEPRMKSKMLNNINSNSNDAGFLVPPSPMSRGRKKDDGKSRGFHDLEDDDDKNNTSDSNDNSSSSKYNEDEKVTSSNVGDNDTNNNIDEGKVMERNIKNKSREEKTQAIDTNESQYTYPPSTPPLRPKSKEKQRWLSRMKALECGTARPNDRQHRPSLIARHDETRAVDVCGRKHFFIEPMEWMGKLDNVSGPISCANEMCKLQLGHYDWRGLSTVPLNSDTTTTNDSKTKDGNDDEDGLFIVPAFRIESGLVITQESL